MIRSVLLAALVGIAACPAPARAIGLPPSREVRLPNGALVILAEKHDVPLIAFRALLRGGSIADPPGMEGVASLTGGLLRKGAGSRTAQEIAFTECTCATTARGMIAWSAVSIDGRSPLLSRTQDSRFSLPAAMVARTPSRASLTMIRR